MPKDIHVTFNSELDQWQLKAEGEETIRGAFATKDEAIEAGKEEATTEQSELVIHDQKGTIREKNSYGNDPRESAG